MKGLCRACERVVQTFGISNLLGTLTSNLCRDYLTGALSQLFPYSIGPPNLKTCRALGREGLCFGVVRKACDKVVHGFREDLGKFLFKYFSSKLRKYAFPFDLHVSAKSFSCQPFFCIRQGKQVCTHRRSLRSYVRIPACTRSIGRHLSAHASACASI